MKDFNPTTLLAIAQEFLGAWFWAAVAFAAIVVLAWLLVIASGRMRKVGLGRAFKPAALIGLVLGVASALALPLWTGARIDQLQGLVDYAAVAGGGVGAFVAATLIMMPIVAGVRAGRR